MSLTKMADFSAQAEDIYGKLLKRYKEFGYLRPEDALNHDIRLIETRGKTAGEAILHMYKGTTDETIELIEQYVALRAQIQKPEEEAQPSIPKSQVQKKNEEIMATQS